MHVWMWILAIVILLGLVVFCMSLPDLIRYLRIKRM